MNNEVKRSYEEEMKEEAARLMKEIHHDPDLKDVTAPADAYENILRAIRAKEAEEKELIRLGTIYKRKRKNRKYLVLAAAMVFMLAFGITSMGGPERVCKKITWMLAGREQINIDSGSGTLEPISGVDEEEAYEEIEDKFGFYPVRLNYFPEGIEFQEATIGDSAQGINLVYGKNDEAKISYWIRPNDQDSSWSKDIEDELLEEYEIKVKDVVVEVKKYLADDEIVRWLVLFEHNDVNYSISILDMEKEEVDKFITNLHFF